jgi:hypothetical protein
LGRARGIIANISDDLFPFLECLRTAKCLCWETVINIYFKMLQKQNLRETVILDTFPVGRNIFGGDDFARGV